MVKTEIQPREILEFQIERNVVNLYKQFLVMLEDLENDRSVEFEKLKESLPEKYQPILEQSNYLRENKSQYLRKKILDLGNESKRAIFSQMEFFNINIK